LSYSKNPLGVRTPTGTTNGPSGQHGILGTASNAPCDAFQSRALNEVDPRMRRDVSGVTSPTCSSYQYSVSPPPPRFVSPPPGPPSFNSMSFQRVNNSALTTTSSTSFSPFGISPSPQPSFINSNIHFTPIPEHSSSSTLHSNGNSNSNTASISDSTEQQFTIAPSSLTHSST
jgi:hypothetical protein